MRYTSAVIFGLIMFAVGFKFEYHSDPQKSAVIYLQPAQHSTCLLKSDRKV